MDFRVEKTYAALEETFVRLLEEKRFEDITVIDLCQRARVRRATFYKHFGDKYEFFTFVIQKAQKRFDAGHYPPEDQTAARKNYVDIFRHILEFVEENERLVRSVVRSSASPVLFALLEERIAADISEKLKADQKQGLTLPADPEVAACMFSGALLDLAVWWARQKERPPREWVLAQVEAIMEKL